MDYQKETSSESAMQGHSCRVGKSMRTRHFHRVFPSGTQSGHGYDEIYYIINVLIVITVILFKLLNLYVYTLNYLQYNSLYANKKLTNDIN